MTLSFIMRLFLMFKSLGGKVLEGACPVANFNDINEEWRPLVTNHEIKSNWEGRADTRSMCHY